MAESIANLDTRIICSWEINQVASAVEEVMENMKYLFQVMRDLTGVVPDDERQRCEGEAAVIKTQVNEVLKKAQLKINEINSQIDNRSVISKCSSCQSRASRKSDTAPSSPAQCSLERVKCESISGKLICSEAGLSDEQKQRQIEEDIAALEVAVQYEPQMIRVQQEAESLKRRLELDQMKARLKTIKDRVDCNAGPSITGNVTIDRNRISGSLVSLTESQPKSDTNFDIPNNPFVDPSTPSLDVLTKTGQNDVIEFGNQFSTQAKSSNSLEGSDMFNRGSEVDPAKSNGDTLTNHQILSCHKPFVNIPNSLEIAKPQTEWP